MRNRAVWGPWLWFFFADQKVEETYHASNVKKNICKRLYLVEVYFDLTSALRFMSWTSRCSTMMRPSTLTCTQNTNSSGTSQIKIVQCLFKSIESVNLCKWRTHECSRNRSIMSWKTKEIKTNYEKIKKKREEKKKKRIFPLKICKSYLTTLFFF